MFHNLVRSYTISCMILHNILYDLNKILNKFFLRKYSILTMILIVKGNIITCPHYKHHCFGSFFVLVSRHFWLHFL